MMNGIENYLDLFDEDMICVVVRDVLIEHFKMLREHNAEEELQQHFLEVISYFSVPSDYKKFLKEIYDES